MTMKKILILGLLIIAFTNVFAQENSKSFDFIIMVDETIWTAPAEPKIIIKDKNGKEINTFLTSYHAGDLSFKESDYKKLSGSEFDSMIMVLKYTDICNDEVQYYNYNIEFKKGWLNNYFFILKIYNTDKKKYRKLFKPLEGKKYTLEYDSSNGQMLQITKKKRKKECCN